MDMMARFVFVVSCASAVLASAHAECGIANARPFSVAMPGAPESWEKTAVAELKAYLGKSALDGRVTVEGCDAVVFHVGDTDFAKAKGLGSNAFADEEWCIRSFGRDVVLNGGGTRGALYAVFRFLEDECGIRWWMDGDEDVPAARPLKFAKLDRRGKPFFAVRDVYRDSPADFRTAARNRLNGNGKVAIPMAWGGGVTYGSPHHCHVWNRYLPFEKFGKRHPEWYSLRKGKRVGVQSAGQLCLSNPEVSAMIEDGVRKSIAADAAKAKASDKAPPRIYDLSMNDNHGFCECANCKAEVDRVGHSGQQLRFVNEIARRIGKDHPGLMFQTLAYHYSEPVPKSPAARADDNVLVRFCNTRQNMAAGIFEKDNQFIHDQVVAWSRFAKNLTVWDYAITYREPTRGFPFASEFHIAEKVRFYAEHGVTGLFFEHEEPQRSDMFELKFYIECKMFEDPSRDGDELIADFMNRYYGAAGAKVLEARRILEKARVGKHGFVTWFPSFSEFNYISNDDIAAMERLYDEAMAAVNGDAKLGRRVEKARASVRRLHDYRARFGAKHPPETGVSDTPFFDFPVVENLYAFHDRSHKLIDTTVDSEIGEVLAGGAKVVRIRADAEGYEMPFSMGVYDFVNKKVAARKRWENPAGPGYNWYDLGEVTLPNTFFVYFTRQWTVDLPVGMEGLNGGRFKIKALVKFTGPRFFAGSTEPNEIRIARTIFADP